MFISPCLSFIFLSLVWNFSDRDITLNREFGSSSLLRHNIAKIANFPAGADNIKRTRLHYHRQFMFSVAVFWNPPRHINQDQTGHDSSVSRGFCHELENIASCYALDGRCMESCRENLIFSRQNFGLILSQHQDQSSHDSLLFMWVLHHERHTWVNHWSSTQIDSVCTTSLYVQLLLSSTELKHKSLLNSDRRAKSSYILFWNTLLIRKAEAMQRMSNILLSLQTGIFLTLLIGCFFSEANFPIILYFWFNCGSWDILEK